MEINSHFPTHKLHDNHSVDHCHSVNHRSLNNPPPPSELWTVTIFKIPPGSLMPHQGAQEEASEGGTVFFSKKWRLNVWTAGLHGPRYINKQHRVMQAWHSLISIYTYITYFYIYIYTYVYVCIYTCFVRSKSSGWHFFGGLQTCWSGCRRIMAPEAVEWRLTRDPKSRSFNHSHSYYSYPYHVILIVVLLLCCHSYYYLTVTVDALRKTGIVRSWGNGSSWTHSASHE